MIIPVVYGRAVLSPIPVYRYDADDKVYIAYIVNENPVSSIKVYINKEEYAAENYQVSYQGDTVFSLPDGTQLSYPHVNSVLVSFPIEEDETISSSQLKLECYVDGSVVFDLVSGVEKVSYNPINFIYDYLTNTKYGNSIAASLLNTACFETEAEYAVHYGLINTCDFGLVIDSDDSQSNLDKLKLHANAVLFDSNGLVNIAITRLREPVFNITDDYIVVGSVKFTKGKFSDALSSLYVETRTVPEWYTRQYNLTNPDIDSGKSSKLVYEYIEDAELPAVWGRQYIDQQSNNDSLQLSVKMSGLRFEPFDIVTIDYSELDITGRYRIEKINYTTASVVRLDVRHDPVELYDNTAGTGYSVGGKLASDKVNQAPGSVSNINITETVSTLADGAYNIILTVSWASASRARSYAVKCVNGGITQSNTTESLSTAFKVIPGSAEIEITPVSYAGVSGAVYSAGYIVSGSPALPLNITGLSAVLTRSGIALSWEKSSSPDVLRYDIYTDDVFHVSVTGTEYVFTITAAGEFIFRIVTVNKYGLESSGASITVYVPLPAAPTDIITTSRLYGIGLTITYLADAYFECVEIYSGLADDISEAVFRGTTQTVYFDQTDLPLVAGYFYWARVRNIFGLVSPWYPGDGGVYGETDTDPEKLLDTLRGSLAEDQLTNTLKARINQIEVNSEAITGYITFSSGVYAEGVYIQSAADLGGANGLHLVYKKAKLQIDENTGILAEHAATIYDAETGLVSKMGLVQETLSAYADDIGNIQAQWTIKTDVNGKVAGVGLVNTGISSAFAVLAGSFLIALDTDDENPVQVFTVGMLGETPAVGIDGNLILNGSLTALAIGSNEIITKSANIAYAVVTDAHIKDMSADKLTAGEIDASEISVINLRGENIVSDSTITLTDGGRAIFGNYNIVIDTDGAGSGVMTVAPDGGPASQHYMTLNNGDIRFYYWDSINSSHVQYKTLKRMENGVADNNTVVNIPGIWKAQPKIMLSPANLQSYDGNYAGQDQSFLLDVASMTVANGRYSFTPKAQLVLSEAAASEIVNLSASNSQTNVTFETSHKNTPSNTQSITVNVKLRSVRGTGVSGHYYYRTVSWRIDYGSGFSAWKGIGLGATLDYVADTMTITVPANVYNIGIEAIAVDSGGEFSVGGESYEYWQDVSNYLDKDQHPVLYLENGASGQMILPDLSIPASYVVYNTAWEIKYGTTGVGASAVFVDMGGSVTLNTNAALNSIKTATSTSFDPSSPTVRFTAPSAGSVTIQNITATVYARKTIVNSTTPENNLTWESASYALASSIILATGTINWLAVGE